MCLILQILIKKTNDISKHFDQISMNFTLINPKNECSMCLLLYLWFFCSASSKQSVPWENPCRNFGRGILRCALRFLQLRGEPNNGLQLPALGDLSTLGLPIPVYKHNISCTFSAPIVWSCLKASYGAKGFECLRWFPSSHLLRAYTTTQSVQFGKKISTMGARCYFLLAHPMNLHPVLALGIKFLISLRWFIGLSRKGFGVRERPEMGTKGWQRSRREEVGMKAKGSEQAGREQQHWECVAWVCPCHLWAGITLWMCPSSLAVKGSS